MFAYPMKLLNASYFSFLSNAVKHTKVATEGKVRVEIPYSRPFGYRERCIISFVRRDLSSL